MRYTIGKLVNRVITDNLRDVKKLVPKNYPYSPEDIIRDLNTTTTVFPSLLKNTPEYSTNPLSLEHNLAYNIVKEEFIDKVDLNNEPYTKHLQRVASASYHSFSRHYDPDLYTIGMLHDLVEDTDWTILQVKEVFGEVVSNAIEALTRLEEESYMDYIKRISLNSLAVFVKLEDLKDNMDLTRFKTKLSKSDVRRFEKYHKAYLYLTNLELTNQF